MEYLFPKSRLEEWAARSRDRFATAEPFPHIILDDLLDEPVVTQLIEEFPGPEAPCWNPHRHANSDKLACGDDSLMGPTTRQLIWEMNSARFIRFLEHLGGIEGLIPDPLLAGAGLHQTLPGGFLNIHADFNYHPLWKLDRRINLLLYLNRDWAEVHGGYLELWDRGMSRCVVRIAPDANRMVIFASSDHSFHGHPSALACPPGRSRKSIALYYYTNGRPARPRRHTLPSTSIGRNRPDLLRLVDVATGARAVDKPVRVCFLNPLGYPLFASHSAEAEGVSGGAEVQLYYLATQLARDPRFRVATIVERTKALGPDACGPVAIHRVRPVGAAVARLRQRLPIPSGGYLRALRAADADIYIQRGGALLTGEVGLFCSFYRRKFVFMTAHEWDCDRTHQRGPAGLCGRFYNLGLRSAHFIFSQSRHHRELIRRHYGLESDVFPIVYPDDEPPGLEGGRFVLWVGRCLGWKRPDLFLDLAEALPSVRFMMVCQRQPTCPELFVRLRRRAQRMANVAFRGHVPFGQIHGVFRDASVYVNTSLKEGFPNTFVQAARCGVPILSFNVDPDGIRGGKRIGIFGRDDAAECRAGLERLLKDAVLRAEYVANARRHFREAHLLSDQAERFKQALLSLAIS